MVFGMMDDPGVIRRHMVGDKVEDEPQSAFTEHASCGCKAFRTAEMFVDYVVTHAVWRADIVLRRKVREGSSEILKEPLVSRRDLDPGGAPLPDSHEPHSVESIRGDGIPLLLRYRGETHRPQVFLSEFTQPDPGVDFIDNWVPRP
jgi:hypothetical protein